MQLEESYSQLPEKTNGRHPDEIDSKIITLLQESATMPQTEIASRIGLSQSSVALRLARLRDSGLVKTTVSIDYRSLGLIMGKVDVSSNDLEELFKWAKGCPLFVSALVGIGGRSTSLFFVAEDLEMFQSIVDQHIRGLKGVTDLSFTPVVSWIEGNLSTRLNLSVNRSDEPPCNSAPYCRKCPANPDYDGNIWKQS